MTMKWKTCLTSTLLASLAVTAVLPAAYGGVPPRKPARQPGVLPRAQYLKDDVQVVRPQRQPQSSAPAQAFANAVLSVVKRRGNSGNSSSASGQLVAPRRPQLPPRRPQIKNPTTRPPRIPDFKAPTQPPRPPKRPELKNPTLPPQPPHGPGTPPGQPQPPGNPNPGNPGNPGNAPADPVKPTVNDGVQLVVRPQVKPTGPDGKFTPDDKQKIRDAFIADLKAGKLDALTNSTIGKQLKLGEQYQAAAKGDLGLWIMLLKQKGLWQLPQIQGLLAPGFHNNGVSYCFPGPGIFPHNCVLPVWCGWYSWCWNSCWHPVCPPCGPWTWWPCYDWHPLHSYCCGAWYYCPPVIHDRVDLQLIGVRHVDGGNPEHKLGQRVRLKFVNASNVDVRKNFNVMIFASNTPQLLNGSVPHAGVRIEHMAGGEERTLDIRLPYEAGLMSVDAEGKPAPYKYLHAIVDADREVHEVRERNNGAVIPRTELLPVDPLAFSTDQQQVPAGSPLSIAAEGIGPVPGQVLVFFNGLEMQAEIVGWTEHGVQVNMPNLPIVAPTPTEIILIRADGAAAPPLPVTLLPAAP